MAQQNDPLAKYRVTPAPADDPLAKYRVTNTPAPEATPPTPTLMERWKTAGTELASAVDAAPFAPQFPNVPDWVENLLRPQVSSTVRAISDPENSRGDVAALAAQFIPPVRGAKMVATGARVVAPKITPIISALKNLGSSAWRSALGGGVAHLNEGLGGAAEEAAMQAGWDLAGGGVMTGLGSGGRALGRRFATKAVNPTDVDLLNFQEAFTNRPEFHTNPGTFIPGRARHQFADKLEEEAMERRPGGFGGTTDAEQAVLRADITGAQKEDLVRKTVGTTNPVIDPTLYRRIEQAAARGDDTGLQALLKQLDPVTTRKAEYTVNLDDIADAGRGRAFELGGPGMGGTPHADRAAGNRAVDDFMARDRDMRPVDSPWAALPEPKVKVELGGGSDGLANPAGVTDPAAAIPNLERGPRVAEAAGTTPTRRGRTDLDNAGRTDIDDPLATRDAVGRGTGIGDVMASHTPTSVLPTTPQFLGEAVSVGRVAPQPTGGSMMMDAAEARAQGLAPQLPLDNTVGFDTALQIRQNLDDSLLRHRQSQIGAMAAGNQYVPGPQEKVQHTMREALRQALNAKAPMGQTLQGQPISLEDLLRQERQDITMANIKAQATGQEPHTLRARAGVSPTSGRPSLSMFENINAIGGSIAKPLMRKSRATLDFAPQSPQLARLLYLLSQNQPEWRE